MSEQQTSINNAVTAITTLLTDLSGQTTTILNDVKAVQADLASGTPVDTTALDSAVAGISTVQTALDSAVSTLTTTATPPAA